MTINTTYSRDEKQSIMQAFACAHDDAHILSILKPLFLAKHETLMQMLHNGENTKKICGARAKLVSQNIQFMGMGLHGFCKQQAEPSPIGIMALGGFGRGELAPHSDIDIAIIAKNPRSKFAKQFATLLTQFLWDIGLKPGQSLHSPKSCIAFAKVDQTMLTTLLTRRWIWGDDALRVQIETSFEKTMRRDFSQNRFFQAKLLEREARHEKMGNSLYLLEPNLKDGCGGLRDLHFITWLGAYIFHAHSAQEMVQNGLLNEAQARQFRRAISVLIKLRVWLHLINNRAEEQITFNVQTILAEKCGYYDRPGIRGVERLMRHYFLCARVIQNLCTHCILVTSEKTRIDTPIFKSVETLDGFIKSGRILSLVKGSETDPIKILKFFNTCLINDLAPDPYSLESIQLRSFSNLLRKNPQSGALFMEILCAKRGQENILRIMNECGVLGRLIPDFGHIVAQMQYNMYHVYTTDEHTIRAIGVLNKIECGDMQGTYPVSTHAIHRIISRNVLYAAVFLHDIAKGLPGDHSVVGEAIAEKLCPLFGLSAHETDLVRWLVLYHLLMSNTAFRRDLDDNKTIADFVEQVRTPERLRLLICLTVADITSVGPNVWNNWKATLLRNLYHRAFAHLTGDVPKEGLRNHSQSIREDLLSEYHGTHKHAIIAEAPSAYVLAYEKSEIVLHLDLLTKIDDIDTKVQFMLREIPEHDVCEIIIATPEQPGLLHKLSGAIAISGISIVNARLNTFANGLALDTFWVQTMNATMPKQSQIYERLHANVVQTLQGTCDIEVELMRQRPAWASRTEIFTVNPVVRINNNGSSKCTIIEVVGRDRPGLVYQLAHVLNKLGLRIEFAKISTNGEVATDVFYAKDTFGMKIYHKQKKEQLYEALYNVLQKANAPYVRKSA